MEKVLLTGFTPKEFGARISKGKHVGCYRCHRTNDDETSYIIEGHICSGKLEVYTAETGFLGKTFAVHICIECLIEAKALNEQLAVYEEERKPKQPMGEVNLN